jgi:peptide deformylase
MRDIITIENKAHERILRTVAAPVAAGEVGTTRIQRIITDLKEALSGAHNGIAIAAPQIGESVRIFVVSPKAFSKEGADFLVCINPQISRLSKDKKWLEEGCLSIPGLFGKVERSTKATIKALDEHGNPFTRGASGLLAQIFQHECDHLDGILFTDKATDIREATDGDEVDDE